MRKKVVDPGDAPHTLEVLLCLYGDWVQSIAQTTGTNSDLNTGLGKAASTLTPAWSVPSLCTRYHIPRFYRLPAHLSSDKGPISLRWHCDHTLGSVAWRNGIGRVCGLRYTLTRYLTEMMDRLNGFLPQLIQMRRANLAPALAAIISTSFRSVGHLKLVNNKRRKPWLLEMENKHQLTWTNCKSSLLAPQWHFRWY